MTPGTGVDDAGRPLNPAAAEDLEREPADAEAEALASGSPPVSPLCARLHSAPAAVAPRWGRGPAGMARQPSVDELRNRPAQICVGPAMMLHASSSENLQSGNPLSTGVLSPRMQSIR